MTTSGILKRSFWISLVTVVVLLAALWFGGRGWMAGSVVPYSGEHSLAGLDAQVEVLFDQRGIPRIHAETDADVLRALGWLHARERGFQLELIRRLTRGELADLVGPAALELDVMHRSFGFARRIEEDPPGVDPAVRTLIAAYVEGINAGLDAESLLPEFRLLRHAPRPWTVDDVLAVAYYQTFYPTTLVRRMAEAWRTASAEFGAAAVDWLGAFPDWKTSTVPALRMTEASNTWVVSPRRSTSGAALHASDPHLDFDVAPGLWYAAGLHSAEGLNVLGVTAPGLPFVAMGHNGDIAWAFTVAPVDVFEIYRQQRIGQDQVFGPDGPELLVTRTETFSIANHEPVLRDIQFTPRGPVIEIDDEQVQTLDWAGFRLGIEQVIEHGLAINRASDFESFRRVASDMGALSINWSYSDRAGNIGYVQSSPVPVRNHQRYFQVLDASNPDNIWAGFHPPETRPWALNPEQGWLASANNHAVADNWDYPIPGFYKHLRMRRISTLLESAESFSRDDMTDFQLDRVSDRALSWKDWLADLAEQSGRSALASDLRYWNATMAVDKDTAGLFARWWGFLPHALAEQIDGIGPDHMTMLIDEWLHARTDLLPVADVDLDRAGLAALEDALRAGARPLGAIQTLSIRHAMAENPILNRWLGLTRGPIPTGGDPGSLNVTYAGFDPVSATYRARAGASMRFVMDWSDPDGFTLNLTLGQSGHPLSPHFDDFLADFVSGKPWLVPWTREAVERQPHRRLVLNSP